MRFAWYKERPKLLKPETHNMRVNHKRKDSKTDKIETNKNKKETFYDNERQKQQQHSDARQAHEAKENCCARSWIGAKRNKKINAEKN